MQRFSILIAEDDAIIGWDLRDRLKSFHNLTLYVVESSTWIVANEPDESVDLVITNLKLSDGWITREYLSKIHNSGSLILILTGLSDSHLRNIESSEVEVHYLFKPFTNIQFKKRILQLLSELKTT